MSTPKTSTSGDPGGRPGPTRGVRYRNEVGAQHVGARVSVRAIDAAGEASDVVGRLAAIDDEVLLIVDRASRLHVIARPALLASKIVPAHPRLPAEPDIGHRDAPIERRAGRVLLVDGDEVLLVAHHPTPGETVWTAPGGGIDDGEDARVAARRELAEELGLDVELGPPVLRRSATFPFRGVWITQHEEWFLSRREATRAAVDPGAAGAGQRSAGTSSPLTADRCADQGGIAPQTGCGRPSSERTSDQHTGDPATGAVRWWALAELEATDARIEPPELAAIVARLVAEGPPAEPFELGHVVFELPD